MAIETAEHERLTHHVLTLWSDNLIREFEEGRFLRTQDGYRLSMTLGEPDEQGYYTPIFTVDYSDKLGDSE